MALKLKKGDRVEFISGRGTKYGVVKKGGSRNVTVMVDGGRIQVKGSVSAFEISNKSLPKDSANVMDKYSVIGYKEAGTGPDGMMFSANIAVNGKKVMVVQNGGTGGPNYYHSRGRHLVKQLKEDATEWYKMFCKHEPIEPEDLWVEWDVHCRPYGVLAKEYLNE